MEQTNKIFKVLVIRFSSIGDIVLTTPILRNIKKTYPKTELHFICKKEFQNVIEQNPNIDKCWFLNDNLNEIIVELKKEQFSCIIDLHKNIRSFKIKKELSVPTYTFKKLNYKKWLLTTFKYNTLPKIHLVDRYFEAIKKLQVPNDGFGLDFFINETEKQKALSKLAFQPNNFICLVLGTAHETKSPPISLLKKIISEQTRSIVLLGGKNEIDKASQLMNQSEQENIQNLVGKLSIQGSAAIIKESSLVITPDTGLMHIAAALNKNIISIWGNTVPQFGMYPYYGNNRPEKANYKISEVKDLKCRPCSKIGYNTCPKKHFNCMNMQSSEQICKWIKEN